MNQGQSETVVPETPGPIPGTHGCSLCSKGGLVDVIRLQILRWGCLQWVLIRGRLGTGGPVAKTPVSQCREALGSIPSQGTRSCVLHLRSGAASNK